MKVNCPICKKDFDIFATSYRHASDIDDLDLSKARTKEDLDELKSAMNEPRRDKFSKPSVVKTPIICPNGCCIEDKHMIKSLKKKMNKAKENPIPIYHEVRAQVAPDKYVIGHYFGRCQCSKKICNINYIKKFDGEMIVALDGDIQITYPEVKADNKKYIEMWNQLKDNVTSMVSKSEISDDFKVMIISPVIRLYEIMNKPEYMQEVFNILGKFIQASILLDPRQALSSYGSTMGSIIGSFFDVYGCNMTKELIEVCFDGDYQKYESFMEKMVRLNEEGEE